MTRSSLGVGLLLVLSLSEAQAQETSTDPATQIWGNLTLGKAVNERMSLELDIEPKVQVTDGEEWRNVDLTPLVEYYATAWVDLTAESAVGYTRQRDGLDTLEITPRLGAKLHLIKRVIGDRKGERLPLTRFDIATLVRLEWRNFFYSDDTPDGHEWRARLRLQGKLALNHKTLSRDRTLYAMGDGEYFAPLGDDIPERYVSKFRSRLGLGYRIAAATRLELLYIRDWNRSTPDADSAQQMQAFNLRFTKVF